MDGLDCLWAKSNGETIREHTDKLLKCFDDFCTLYGESFDSNILKAVKYACEYHDYGKASYIFQKRIGNKEFINSFSDKSTEETYIRLGFGKNIPHGYLSPVFMKYSELKKEFDEETLSCLYTAIYHHHNRDAELTAAQLKEIIDADFRPRFGDKAKSSKYMTKLLGGDNLSENQWINYAVIIGLLNKFDYYASDVREKYPVEISGEYNGRYISDYVYDKITEKYSLRDVQKFMLENQNENLIITASTGIGKTEAALLWAGKSKLFYTLPLKVSINAMYERIKNEYGYSPDKVTLLHSDVLSVLTSEDSETNPILKYDASKRLSYPITVCTIDQLFSFVYKYRGGEILLASLKYSKILIDEIQSYEPKIIAKLIYGLKLIAMAGGKFAVITATLPPVLMHFIDDVYHIEHKKQEQFLLNDKIRHRIHYEKSSDFDYEKILSDGKSKKVLIICNTVRRACEVYKKICNEYDFENVKLLHSKFMKKHRSLLESEIINFSESESCGIRISTQIVEASLDIDFDVLYTEMCTADSLLQRMGRCYRKREYTGEDPNVYITDNGNGYGTVYKYKDIYDRSAEFLEKYNNNFFCENDKMDYVDMVYDTEALMKSNSEYFNDIKKELKFCEHITPFEISKETAKKKFRNIISYMVIPESEYNQNPDKFSDAYHILTNKNKSGFSQRLEAKQFIEDHCISLGNYDVRTREKCSSLFDGLDYYTLNYAYDFDEENLCGTGLEYFKDEDCFI